MKMKSTALTVLAITILATVMITPIHAAYNVAVYARTDKSSYLPGDSGSLIVTVKNLGTQSFTVKNVTVVLPWMAFITDHWDGNFTVTAINQPVGTPGGTFNAQYPFTVPNDGRGHSGDATVTIGTDIPNGPFSTPQTTAFVQVATAAYEPFGLTTSLLPLISIVLLGVAVVMLALVYMGIRKQSKK
jgi:hypothetical protein